MIHEWQTNENLSTFNPLSAMCDFEDTANFFIVNFLTVI